MQQGRSKAGARQEQGRSKAGARQEQGRSKAGARQEQGRSKAGARQEQGRSKAGEQGSQSGMGVDSKSTRLMADQPKGHVYSFSTSWTAFLPLRGEPQDKTRHLPDVRAKGGTGKLGDNPVTRAGWALGGKRVWSGSDLKG